jgi:hypothetical protein
MPIETIKLRRKLVVLGILIASLLTLQALAPEKAYAQSCEVADLIACSNLELSLHPDTCECIPYCPLIEPDCTEQGHSGLNYNTCQCYGGTQSALTVCDFNPYAHGCPGSFDSIFSGVTEYYGTGQCSRSSSSSCASIGGFYNYTSCSCNVATVTGFCSSTAISACQNSGGTLNTQNCTCGW